MFLCVLNTPLHNLYINLTETVDYDHLELFLSILSSQKIEIFTKIFKVYGIRPETLLFSQNKKFDNDDEVLVNVIIQKVLK